MDLHLHLRNGTRAIHRKTEHLFALDEAALTAQRYRRFLVVMSAVHERFAPGITTIEAAYGGSIEQLRTALQRDLDLENGGEEIAAPASPTAESVAHRWGHAYVLAGSSLGASVIRKRVRRFLPAATPSVYLDLSAASARHQWPLFLKALNESGINKTGALAGATDAFDFVAASFSETLS